MKRLFVWGACCVGGGALCAGPAGALCFVLVCYYFYFIFSHYFTA